MKLIIIVILVNLLFSCRILNWKEEVQIRFPDLSDNLFYTDPSGWILSYPDCEGDLIEEVLPGDKNQTVKVSLEKGSVSTLLLQPFFTLDRERVFSVLPAGFLYPYDGDSLDQCIFSWEQGPICQMLLHSRQILNGESVNLNRLMELTKDNADGESPWVLDWQNILEELASGQLSYYDVRKKRPRSVSLILKSGTWMNCDPQSPDLVSSGEDIPLDTTLYSGISRYLHDSGIIVEIFVYSDGTYEYLFY